MTDFNLLKEKIKEFNSERNWDQFHNPKDLLVALVSEVGELADCYRWLSSEELYKVHKDPEKKIKIEEEIADIMMYLMILTNKTDIDLLKTVENKLEKNAKKYPLNKCKGVHSNAIEGFKGKY